MKIAFIHPDLGIGGAERLVVDAAMALKGVPHNKVSIYTSHCDKNHCFEEVANNEFPVTVYGDFLPTDFQGKFAIVFAFLRQLVLVCTLILNGKLRQYDVIVVDQLSYCMPLLHFAKKPGAKTLFYCHFPDKLLASHRGLLRKLYRVAFDFVEEVTTSVADTVVVNSKFTRKTVQRQFSMLSDRQLDVVYPCVPSKVQIDAEAAQQASALVNGCPFFLSVNRFERKKHIQLAIQCYARYVEQTGDSVQKLVVSGGYDERVAENKQYLKELERLCETLNLSSEVYTGNKLPAKTASVIFLPSVSTPLKNALLSMTDLLLYTPSYEHFGIVPLEAMQLGTLVLADNTGGPLETVVSYFDDKEKFTGFTVEADAEKWSDILELVKGFSEKEMEEVSERNKKRVEDKFSFEAMQDSLCKAIDKCEPREYGYEKALPFVAGFLVMAVAVKSI